jgi:hypothetical protein
MRDDDPDKFKIKTDALFHLSHGTDYRIMFIRLLGETHKEPLEPRRAPGALSARRGGKGNEGGKKD